jgi:hypothetical protein
MTQTQDSACPFNVPPLAEFLKTPPTGKPEKAMIGLFNTAFGIGCSITSMVGLLNCIASDPDRIQRRKIPHFGALVVRRESKRDSPPVYSFRWPGKPTVYVRCERQGSQFLLVGWSLEH